MILPNEAISHAIQEWPKESVGYVKGEGYVPLTNIAEEPETSFVLSEADSLLVHTQEADAVIHSHPQGNKHPSARDMEFQAEMGIPYGIIVLNGERQYVESFFFGDQLPMADLLGRQFRHGIHDCYALVRDWYKVERQIELPLFPRDSGWWNVEGVDLIEKNFKAAGFEEVEGFETGDVLAFSIGSSQTNHLAIYLQNGLMMHHLANRLSRREPVATWGRHYLRKVLRYAG